MGGLWAGASRTRRTPTIILNPSCPSHAVLYTMRPKRASRDGTHFDCPSLGNPFRMGIPQRWVLHRLGELGSVVIGQGMLPSTLECKLVINRGSRSPKPADPFPSRRHIPKLNPEILTRSIHSLCLIRFRSRDRQTRRRNHEKSLILSPGGLCWK